MGHVAPSEKWEEEEEEEQNEDLASRTEKFVERFQKIEKAEGIASAYHEDGTLVESKEEVMHELGNFFEFDSKEIPKMEIGERGGNYRNELKKITDTLWGITNVFLWDGRDDFP